MENFRNLALAYEAIRLGGNMPCIMNAANEVVVSAFLKKRIGFTRMPEIIGEIMEKAEFLPDPTLDDYIATNSETRRMTELLIENDH
jgi:1-deoxy-D-xylulose-5-phosphate reductoisomerase